MNFDPRLTPARPDLAAAHLRGQVETPHFAEGQKMTVSAPVLDLTAQPARTAGLASQLLLGETFTVYDDDPETGLAWGQSETDGYVGYVSRTGLRQHEDPTSQVTALVTHLYPEPNLKTRPLEAMSQCSRLTTTGTDGDFVAVAGGGYCPVQHVGDLQPFASDPVAVAEGFEGLPYLWGGRSAFGLDCSALVQLSHAATGVSLPRDSDMLAGVGAEVDGPLQRGDLICWKGHIGMMVDAETLLHANAAHMAVAREPLAEVITRIRTNGYGEVTAKRRL